MKCPECGNVYKHKDGLKCKACGYTPTFDPKQDHFTDGKFLALIRKASANDTQYFTLNQLYAQYCRTYPGSYVKGGVALLMFVAFFTMIALCNGSPTMRIIMVGLLVTLLVAVLLLWWSGFLSYVPDRNKFERLVARWQDKRGPIEKLVQQPRLHEPPPQWQEPDIYDYGFERLLIVERDELVDLLVLNGVHAQERALVISEKGYPAYLLPLASKALQENPDLPVFLLHDATPQGVLMMERVRLAKRFPLGDRHVTDLGLFPQDVRRLGHLHRTHNRGESEVPVDYMAMGMMTLGIAGGLAGGMAFADMLSSSATTQQISGSSSGDFG